MYTIRLAEEKNGELQLQGLIEVHHLPAVGDTLTHQTVISGKMVKVYGQVVKVMIRPPEYHPIDAVKRADEIWQTSGAFEFPHTTQCGNQDSP